jgi:hypothetical protein
MRWKRVPEQKEEDRLGPGLRRFAAVEGAIIVKRPAREPTSDSAFQAQHCSLILDKPDAAGNEIYPCKITDVSQAGFGIICSAAQKAPHPFRPGTKMTLHDAEGKSIRVEVRWANNGRLGLRRLDAKPR